MKMFIIQIKRLLQKRDNQRVVENNSKSNAILLTFVKLISLESANFSILLSCISENISSGKKTTVSKI